jgi:hypothetical protein
MTAFGEDLNYRRSLGRHIKAFMNIENLLNRLIITGRTLVDTLGAPRLVSVGLKLKLFGQ